jgi:hypothetical protein
MGVGVSLLLSSGVVASMARAQATGDPAAVIAAYEMARNRRDMDGALSYFADDATVTQRATTFTGKDDIRKFLDTASTRSRFVVVSDRRTNGTHVTWTERSGTQTSPNGQQGPPPALAAGGPPNGFVLSVEAIVQDGKIRSLAYAAANQPARTDPAQDGREQVPAYVGLGAVAGVIVSVLMFASIGLRRRAGARSTLQGRLMPALQGWSAARE